MSMPKGIRFLIIPGGLAATAENRETSGDRETR
jgi:hypothetical protein